MKGILKGHTVIIAHLLLGLVLLLGMEKLKMPPWLNTSAAILIVFILINIADEYILKLPGVLKEYWSVKKLHYLFIGITGGCIIRFLPEFFAWAAGFTEWQDFTLKTSVSIASIVLTLIVVGWEELWFRGIFLNYCLKFLSPFHISLVIGFLFMALHFLNPDIELIKTGPALFFAGALLTRLYLQFKNIWLPVGVHFGNNYFSSLISSPVNNHIFFGSDGYLSAIILALLYLYFPGRQRRVISATPGRSLS